MSIDNINLLESKIQSAIDSIALHKMEIEELKESKIELENDNQKLKQDLEGCLGRINGLISKLDAMAEEVI